MKKDAVDAVVMAAKMRHLHLLQKLKGGTTLTAAELKELAKHEDKTRGPVQKAKDKKGALAAEQIIKTQKQAAEYAGVRTRTIRRWLAAGMPRSQEGRYIKTMVDFYKRNDGREVSDDRKREVSAQADYKTTKAKLLEMELGLKQGRLVPREDIEKETVRKIIAVKRGLLGMVRKIAARVPPRYRREVELIATEEVTSLINDFAGDIVQD